MWKSTEIQCVACLYNKYRVFLADGIWGLNVFQRKIQDFIYYSKCLNSSFKNKSRVSTTSKSLFCPVFILRCNYRVTLKKNHDFWTSVSSIICTSVCIQKPHRDKKTTLSKQNKSHNIHKSPNPNE